MATSRNIKTPQQLISQFWDKFITKTPGKVHTIFPPSLYATLLPPHGHATPHSAAASYDAAAAVCKARVARIAADCRRTNQKFTDPDFDLKGNQDDCLLSLTYSNKRVESSSLEIYQTLQELEDSLLLDDQALRIRVTQALKALNSKGGGSAWSPSGDDDYNPDPQSVHRVGWIFEKPQFMVDGFSSSDIMQGGESMDCWWLSAVATICHRPDLMENICVARDEECGVYGFVFFRDGDWVPAVVDDYLYLNAPDWTSIGAGEYDPTKKGYKNWRKTRQTGSEALYFASCADENETWLPLMEKAYAKVHGDYNAIWGGWVGEGVEDLTGGVATEVSMEDVLDKNKLWKELLNTDKEFVFGLDILDDPDVVKNGLASGHAYSLLQARQETGEDGKTVQLVQVRNPWGSRGGNAIGEWSGPWSDGSKEWTPFWMNKLDYKFGDDGVFWMTYEDMLLTYTNLYRTRMFDKTWTVVQEWTSVNVAWLTGYLQRKFVVDVKKKGVVVFVVSQLDTRYFVGLEGQYSFLLHFILQKEGAKPGDYISRVRPMSEDFFRANRTISCEVELDEGRYEVLPKLTAARDVKRKNVEQVVKEYAEDKPQKLRQIGLSFDLAHTKAGVPEEEPVVEDKKTEPAKDDKPAEDKAKPQIDTVATLTKDLEIREKKVGNEPSVPLASEEMLMIASGPKPSNAAAPEDANKKDEKPEPVAEEKGGDDKVAEHESDQEDDDEDQDSLPPWNAECVIGLRVYAKDAGVTITLEKPKNDQEAASLAVEEKTAGKEEV